MKWIFGLAICFLGSIPNGFGQNDYLLGGKSLLEIRDFEAATPLFGTEHYRLTWKKIDSSVSLKQPSILEAKKLSENYWNNLGFFCKVEIKMEQKTQFPVRFRLGSVDYVDRLEGKY
ncbi:MAG: hypothetical protein AAF849_03480 [Bacteroidota bacterium]